MSLPPPSPFNPEAAAVMGLTREVDEMLVEVLAWDDERLAGVDVAELRVRVADLRATFGVDDGPEAAEAIRQWRLGRDGDR